eukprot:2134207-Amphidinium_carterae.1
MEWLANLKLPYWLHEITCNLQRTFIEPFSTNSHPNQTDMLFNGPESTAATTIVVAQHCKLRF